MDMEGRSEIWIGMPRSSLVSLAPIPPNEPGAPYVCPSYRITMKMGDSSRAVEACVSPPPNADESPSGPSYGEGPFGPSFSEGLFRPSFSVGPFGSHVFPEGPRFATPSSPYMAGPVPFGQGFTYPSSPFHGVTMEPLRIPKTKGERVPMPARYTLPMYTAPGFDLNSFTNHRQVYERTNDTIFQYHVYII